MWRGYRSIQTTRKSRYRIPQRTNDEVVSHNHYVMFLTFSHSDHIPLSIISPKLSRLRPSSPNLTSHSICVWCASSLTLSRAREPSPWLWSKKQDDRWCMREGDIFKIRPRTIHRDTTTFKTPILPFTLTLVLLPSMASPASNPIAPSTAIVRTFGNRSASAPFRLSWHPTHRRRRW